MRLNQKGISHHLILPAVVILAIGGIGAYIINRSGATGGCSSNMYSQGSSGSCVVELQKLTNKCVTAKGAGGTISADGAFGPLTKDAVIRCQRASGLAADGIVGPRTWGVLDSYAAAAPAPAPAAAPAPTPAATTNPCTNSMFSQGNSGTCVTLIQQKVNGCMTAIGNAKRVATDGAFGPITKDAVVTCQQANSIGADGIVGPQTWGVLMKYGTVSSSTNTGQSAPVAAPAPAAPASATPSAPRSTATSTSSSASILASQQRINACLRSKGINMQIAEDGIWGPQSQAGQNACNSGLTAAQESREARQTAADNRQRQTVSTPAPTTTYTAARTNSQQAAEANTEKRAQVAEKKQSFVQKYVSNAINRAVEVVKGWGLILD